MKKAIKVIVIILVIAAALAAGYFFLLPMLMGGSQFNDNIAYVTSVGSLNGEGTFLSNRYSAVIESQEIVNVDTDAEKKISEVYVKEGDTVMKGDKLFEYDIEEMQFQLDQCKLDKEQAQSEVKSYNEQINTLQKEYTNASRNQRLSLDNQIEALRLDIKKAEYSLDTQEKMIKKLENSIKNAVIKSSVDGIIRTVDDPTAEAYITITSSGDYRVKASISEEHIQQFYVDEEITIRSRTDETQTWTGKVVSIDTAKPITSTGGMGGLETTTKYPVYISLDSSEGLLIGQHVTVEESVNVDEDSSKLYLDDFYVCDADSAPYVWVEADGKLAKRSIEIGELDEETFRYEVLSGLESSDYIAFPEDRFYEGMEAVKGFAADEELPDDLLEAEAEFANDIAG